MAKITYANKVALNENANVDPINKVRDIDMNEIKQVVNQNDDNMGDLSDLKTTIKTSIVNAINEVLSSIPTLSNSAGTSTTNGYSQVYLNSVIPTMDSSYGTSTTNGYNKTYINNLNTYDTTERRIGTWGSSVLYRKNITGTLNGTYIEDGFRFTWISSGLSNIVVRKMEYAINTTSSTYAGFSNDVSMQYVRTGSNANKVQVGVNNSAIPNTSTITIVLYYTKS